jgi:hypothetical protein
VGRKSKDLNWKVAVTYLIFVTSIVMGIVLQGNPGQTDSIGVFLVRVGVLAAVVFGSYRKLLQKTNGRALSTIEANLKEIFVYFLISVSLISCFVLFLPSLTKTPNPDYLPAEGPVIIEQCSYDYAQGEVCGDTDLNPEFLQGGEYIRIFVALLIGGAHYFFYTRATKWLKNLKVIEVNGKTIWEAELEGIDLRKRNLTGAQLSHANLTNANLAGAKLVRAELYKANLSGANLSGVNLRGANLKDANLKGADLSHASLRGAILSGATMPNGAIHD